MLGNPGSNPLELFWDTVDSLDQQLDAKIVVAEEIIKTHNATFSEDQQDRTFIFGPETNEEDFLSIIKQNTSEQVGELLTEELHVVFESVSFWIYCSLFRAHLAS